MIPEKRLTYDWLGAYLDLTAELEAKEQLHIWTGLTVIASVLRRRVYLPMEYGDVYPNIYVIIVAESARARKSTAMNFGRHMLIDAMPEMRVMRDSMTSQGLIKVLNHPTQVVKKDRIVDELNSDVAIFADEVANLFSYDKIRASQMVIFLTRTYECPDVYDHTTAKDSLVRLFNLYPVFLGGTDPRNLRTLPPDAVGGLTGRLIWVIENERRGNNPGWINNDRKWLERRLLREYLLHDLRRISNMQGVMKVEQDARDHYDKWYKDLSERDVHDPDTDAFLQRCHVTALHVAMLLSISEGETMLVNMRHIQAAIVLIEKQLPEMKRAALWHGSNEYEQQRAKVILFMSNNKGGGFRRPLMKHLGVTVEVFEQIMDTLKADGSIEEMAGRIRGDVVYKLLTYEKKKVT